MRRAQVLQGALASLSLLAPAAHAASTGWPELPARCHAELKPDWAAQAARGRRWDTDSAGNLRKLQEMSDRICPDYFKRPNDSDAIRAFNASKAFILDQSPVVEKQGDELLAFLQSGYADYSATFLPAGIDFSANPCGVHLRATAEGTKARLAEIRSRIERLARTCFGVTAKENTQALKAHVAGPKGQGSAAPPNAAPRGKGSDITGTEESKAKSK